MSKKLFLVFGIMFWFAASSAWGKTVYVTVSGQGLGNGTSWNNACLGLKSGLAAAVAGDEIWVAGGTYKLASRDDFFIMKSGVALFGGFAGTETKRDQRNWRTNETIMSGDIGTPGEISDNCNRILAGASNAALDGFTITGGNSKRILFSSGALYNNYVKFLSLSNCKFSGNYADQEGAAIYNYNSSITITSCTLVNNSATSYGGAIYNWFSTLKMTSCTLVANTSNEGGAIYDLNTVTSLTDCTFSGNHANLAGGATYNTGWVNYDSAVNVNNCTFTDNTASDGGAMYNGYCADYLQVIKNSVFIGNTSFRLGGAIFNQDRLQTIVNCVFIGNSSVQGGAIYNASFGGLPFSIKNSCLAGNSAASGGAINNYGASEIVNCTVTSNTATAAGGALYNFGKSPTFTNCIVWNNKAPEGAETYLRLGTPIFTNCDVQSCGGSGSGWKTFVGTDGGGNIEKDPKFAAPANLAGPDRQWRTADDGLSLKSGSPCIDAGIVTTGDTVIDIVHRLRDQRPDLGAYEYTKNGAAGWVSYQ